jgi:hypothetical protein
MSAIVTALMVVVAIINLLLIAYWIAGRPDRIVFRVDPPQ